MSCFDHGSGTRLKRYDEAMQPPLSDDVPRRSGSRVAFFGGSFDPPHLGHLAIARAARDAFHLDAVLFAPVGAQPLKPEGSQASFADRVAMTRLAIEGEPAFAVSLADAPKHSESNPTAPNYTIDTLKELRAVLAPDSVLFCLMGADSFFGLRQWHRAAEIPFVATLIVAWRPGQPLENLREALPEGLTVTPAPDGSRFESGIEVRTFLLTDSSGKRAQLHVLPGLDVEISASAIRSSMRNERSAAAGVSPGATALPRPVTDYIRSHGLYR
jgi:nicotinate-nucleotide adenylyltransferase